MRYAKLRDNVVINITTGPLPDDTWMEYPENAPSLGIDYRVVLGPSGFVKEPINFDAIADHSIRRLKQYPPIGDQLDAIWKALDPLITHPEARAILDQINTIKQSIPKE